MTTDPADPTPMATLFDDYYTANPITDATIETDFNDTEVPTFADITEATADAAQYLQEIAVSNYSQAITDTTDDTITTQWGITWAMTFQTTQWTAAGTEVYQQYFAPKFAIATDTNYANYVCTADNTIAAGDTSGPLADAATITHNMRATDVNWPATLTADAPADVAASQALGTEFTYTDLLSITDAFTSGSVAADDANSW
jgi:hypothetical protein